MGPPESPTGHPENQAAGRRKRLRRRPRTRRCLLKGCRQRFRPHQARQRYCSERCREAARKWSRWKPQQRYRAATAGKEKRNGKACATGSGSAAGKPAEPEAVDEPARVITNEEFFRSFVRPARLLREVRAPAAKSLAALLFASMPAGAGARARAGAALERGARLNPDILNHRLALA